MNKALATRERLLTEARRLLWARGYSNVSLREIAQGAGVDVALISRYFGSKLGLFEATIKNAFDPPEAADIADMVEIIVNVFVYAPRDGEVPSVIQLMQMNATDPEVGEIVRRAQARDMQGTLDALIGDSARAALFMAVLLGYSAAEKSLKLDGIAQHNSPEYEAQLRHLLNSALSYQPKPSE
jgi:AcrR family transcriptional regulator